MENKKVFDMSQDELKNWELEKNKDDEKYRQAAMAIATGIDTVLEALGVDTTLDDNKLQAQMMNLGIFIKSYDNLPDVASQIQGFYVFQMRYQKLSDITREPVAIAFIGNPHVDSTGQVNVMIQWFDRNTMDIVQGPKLKEAK